MPILSDSYVFTVGVFQSTVSETKYKAVKRNKQKKKMKEQPVPGGSCEDSWVVSHFFLLLCVVCSSPVTPMEKADCWGGLTGLHCAPGGFAPLPSTVLRMDCDDHMVPFSLPCTFRRENPCSSVFLLRDDFCFCKSVQTVFHLLLRSQHQCAQI